MKPQLIYFLALLVALMVAAAESISYFGFIAKHITIPAFVFYLTSLVVLLIPKVKLPYQLQQTWLIGNIGLLLTYLALTIAEFFRYPNYVYSLTHIHLKGLQVLLMLTWMHWIYFQVKGPALRRLSLALICASLIFATSEGLCLSIAFLGKQLRMIASAPHATYEDKVVKEYGGFYPAMQLVTSLTPDNALILIPPQANPWEIEGNAPLVTYYLYPRQVQNLKGTIPASDRPVYALIARGSWKRTGGNDYGWPKQSLDTLKLWRFDLNSGTAIEYLRAYNPEHDTWDWGLIEVNHE